MTVEVEGLSRAFHGKEGYVVALDGAELKVWKEGNPSVGDFSGLSIE